MNKKALIIGSIAAGTAAVAAAVVVVCLVPKHKDKSEATQQNNQTTNPQPIYTNPQPNTNNNQPTNPQPVTLPTQNPQASGVALVKTQAEVDALLAPFIIPNSESWTQTEWEADVDSHSSWTDAEKTLAKNAIDFTNGQDIKIALAAFHGHAIPAGFKIPSCVKGLGDMAFANRGSSSTTKATDSQGRFIGDVHSDWYLDSSKTPAVWVDSTGATHAYSADTIKYITTYTKLVYPDSLVLPLTVTDLGEYSLSAVDNTNNGLTPAQLAAPLPKNFVIHRSLTTALGALSGRIFDGSVIWVNDVTEVPSGLASEAFVKSSFVIPTNVTSIGSQAFRLCQIENGFKIPDHVTTINERAFEQTQLPDSFSLPASITTIGTLAFNDGIALQNVNTSKTLPANLFDRTKHYAANIQIATDAFKGIRISRSSNGFFLPTGVSETLFAELTDSVEKTHWTESSVANGKVFTYHP